MQNTNIINSLWPYKLQEDHNMQNISTNFWIKESFTVSALTGKMKLSKIQLNIRSERDQEGMTPSRTTQRPWSLKLPVQSEMWCGKQEGGYSQLSVFPLPYFSFTNNMLLAKHSQLSFQPQQHSGGSSTKILIRVSGMNCGRKLERVSVLEQSIIWCGGWCPPEIVQSMCIVIILKM